MKCKAIWIVFPLVTLMAKSLPAADASHGVERRFPSERRVYRDEVTGQEVVALTTSPAAEDKIYQTHPSWTPDGRYIVFSSDRTGSRQLFAVEEQSGRIVQLTDAEELVAGQVCLSRQYNRLITVVGRELVLIDFDSILSAGDAHCSAASGLSRNNLALLLVGGVSDGDRKPGSSESPTESPPTSCFPTAPSHKTVGAIPSGAVLSGAISWSASEEAVFLGLQWHERPPRKRWSIHALNVQTGKSNEVVALSFRVGHTQANPFGPDLIMYCDETGGDTPQRMWIVGADGTGNRPFYRETYNEWVTHEVWWDRRRALFTIWPKDKAMRAKPHGIASVDLTGKMVVHSQFPYWHVTGAADSKYAIGDTFSGEIYRVDLETGRRLLLTQGHRLQRKGAHPHPRLHPSGSKVLFVSHHLGSPDLFLVTVPLEDSP